MNFYEPDPKALEDLYRILKDIYVGQVQKKKLKKEKSWQELRATGRTVVDYPKEDE